MFSCELVNTLFAREKGLAGRSVVDSERTPLLKKKRTTNVVAVSNDASRSIASCHSQEMPSLMAITETAIASVENFRINDNAQAASNSVAEQTGYWDMIAYPQKALYNALKPLADFIPSPVISFREEESIRREQIEVPCNEILARNKSFSESEENILHLIMEEQTTRHFINDHPQEEGVYERLFIRHVKYDIEEVARKALQEVFMLPQKLSDRCDVITTSLGAYSIFSQAYIDANNDRIAFEFIDLNELAQTLVDQVIKKYTEIYTESISGFLKANNDFDALTFSCQKARIRVVAKKAAEEEAVQFIHQSVDAATKDYQAIKERWGDDYFQAALELHKKKNPKASTSYQNVFF